MKTAKEYQDLFLTTKKTHFSIENVEKISKEFFDTDFIVDNANEAIINKLLEYFSYDQDSTLDKKKGIMLIGEVGSGKTMIMEIMNILVNQFQQKIQETTFNSINKFYEEYNNAKGGLKYYGLNLKEFTNSKEEVKTLQSECALLTSIVNEYEEHHHVANVAKYILRTIRSSAYLLSDATVLFRAHSKYGHKAFEEVEMDLTLENKFFITNRDCDEEEDEEEDDIKDPNFISFISSNLCIDDLGIEPTISVNYGERTNVMLDILYYRYNLRKKFETHITTNMDIPSIESKYGLRIKDRLREMVNIVYLRGDSRRK